MYLYLNQETLALGRNAARGTRLGLTTRDDCDCLRSKVPFRRLPNSRDLPDTVMWVDGESRVARVFFNILSRAVEVILHSSPSQRTCLIVDSRIFSMTTPLASGGGIKDRTANGVGILMTPCLSLLGCPSRS
jgi:hypothetical protein